MNRYAIASTTPPTLSIALITQRCTPRMLLDRPDTDGVFPAEVCLRLFGVRIVAHLANPCAEKHCEFDVIVIPKHGVQRERAAGTDSSDLRQYRGSAYGTRTRGLCLERAAC